jgi:hypothetical protein
MHGVIGETVKLQEFQNAQNRDSFACDVAHDNPKAMFAEV